MRDRLAQHLATSGLLPRGAKVLVGYSGGADSTCLLHLLVELGYDVAAAHLHHGMRPEADREANLCEAFANDLGVPFLGGKADVPAIARDMGIGIEEAGRHARYQFFRQGAHHLECQFVATAHTRTDFAETVLMNLVRGTGLSGLAGIPAARDGIVRPLLPFSRQETTEYCNSLGLWFHEDPANYDIQFTRARLRHRVMPELAAINPQVEDAISRMSQLVGEEDRFLNGMSAAALEQAEVPQNGELAFLSADAEICFARQRLEHLPAVLFRRAVRLAVEALGASLDSAQTLVVQEGVSQPEGQGAVTAEGGEVVVEWSSDLLKVRQVHPTMPFRYALTVPGETLSEEFGWQFVAYETEPTESAPVRAALDVELDRSAIKGVLYFRTAEPGDQMKPLGFDGHRKLSDLLGEARLTAAARARLPIVCDLIGPIWAPGVCLDDRVKKRPETQRVLRVRLESIR